MNRRIANKKPVRGRLTKKNRNTILEFADFFERLKPKDRDTALSILFVNVDNDAIVRVCNEIDLLSVVELKVKNEK